MRKALLMAAVVSLLAAGAAQAALYLGSDYSSVIYMERNGRSQDLGGGSFDVSRLDQTTFAYVYCIDLVNTITPGRSYSATYTDDGTVHGSAVNHADQVAWLLSNYAMGASGVREKEAALQAAIWHVISPSLVLDTTSKWGDQGYYPQGSETLIWYNTYLAGLPSSSQIDDSILASFYWISPTSGSGWFEYPRQALVANTPVPGTLLLLGSGLVGLVGLARFRRHRSAG